MVEILDSETFYYHSEDSHQGRHSVMRKLLPGYPLTEPGQYVWTVQDDTDYLWRPDEHEELRWISWRQLAPKDFLRGWEEIEREELLAIELGHECFFVGDVATLDLGSEIEIIPRRVYEYVGLDTWIVDLKHDTCRFQVYGRSKRDWMMRHAVLDEPLTVAIRKYEFQGAV